MALASSHDRDQTLDVVREVRSLAQHGGDVAERAEREDRETTLLQRAGQRCGRCLAMHREVEIGLRHHRSKKNQTDQVDAVDVIHFRYLAALIYPITATLKPFLAKKGHSAEQVDRMHQAWIKSVLLQVILWSYPYIREGDF